jgi:hypothetical protein
MIPKECKRLAEVDFPIAVVSKWAAKEKSNNHLAHLAPNERRVAEDRRDCYWLYVVTNCSPTEAAAEAGNAEPVLEDPIKDPARFPWHEVTKVAHYWLEVDALTKPMQVREPEAPPYGGRGA